MREMIYLLNVWDFLKKLFLITSHCKDRCFLKPRLEGRNEVEWKWMKIII